jgi:hypothetical protein
MTFFSTPPPIHAPGWGALSQALDNCIGMNELNVTEIIATDNQPEL